jgi:hypothetical protein
MGNLPARGRRTRDSVFLPKQGHGPAAISPPVCVCVCVRASRDRRAGEERAGPGGALPTNGPMSGRSAVPGTVWRRRKSACLLAAAGVASVAGTAAGLRAPGVALAASLLVSGLIQSHGDTTCCKLPLSLSLLLAHEHSSTNTRT